MSEHHWRTWGIIEREGWAVSSNKQRRYGFDAQCKPPSVWTCDEVLTREMETKLIILLVNMRMSSMPLLCFSLTSGAHVYMMPREISAVNMPILEWKKVENGRQLFSATSSYGKVFMAQSQQLPCKTWTHSLLDLMVNCLYFYTWVFASGEQKHGNPVPQSSPV